MVTVLELLLVIIAEPLCVKPSEPYKVLLPLTSALIVTSIRSAAPWLISLVSPTAKPLIETEAPAARAVLAGTVSVGASFTGTRITVLLMLVVLLAPAWLKSVTVALTYKGPLLKSFSPCTFSELSAAVTSLIDPVSVIVLVLLPLAVVLN